MRMIIAAIIVIGLIAGSYSALAAAPEKSDGMQAEQLNKLADQALMLAKQERYGEAKRILVHFSARFMDDPSASGHFDMHDLKVAVTVHQQAVDAMTKVQLPHEQRVQAMTQFRFVVDALFSEHQPLWLTMKGVILGDLQELKASAARKDHHEYQQRLNRFIADYTVIHPAVSLDRPEEDVQMLHSYIAHLDNDRMKSSSYQEKLSTLADLEASLNGIFSETDLNSADPSLFAVIYSIGGVILSALFYAGWKKYRAEREKRHYRRKSND
ncbi:sporulation protein YpjB [Bacillus marinisedimentorum]|uniref:sporulation protein YpjB n=1 Tax=Bacillus marinisedimentorum TaxID=1821260 RepID=UPI000871FE6E|nr:sporulation protein YpjB [Bacillus marinisedimentorum]